jgi:hypothetical protein
MKYFSFLLIFFSAIILTTSCNNKEQIKVDLGYDYYPLTTGHYITYKVDSFYFSDGSYPVITIDTVSYQIKEMIDTIFKDNENRDAYRIVRYRRPDASSNWEIDRIWSAVRNTTNLVKNEDDLHFIKLTFPISNDITWSGNSLIVTDGDNAYLKDWQYKYENINQVLSFGTLLFDSCVTVNQLDEENLIEKKYSIEQYSKGVGMVFKEEKFLGKQRNLSSGWDFPETGIWVRYKIIDHN